MVLQSLFRPPRRMFPAMRVKILGLDPHQQYYIAMDIVPVDNKRYRYVLRSFSPPPTRPSTGQLRKYVRIGM